jgi:two-component system, chemotaxis family, protein-glutamate methylesterase/glutaminase
MSSPNKIKVLVIDDSALVRKAISDALSLDPEIEVVGTANDPLIAQEKMPKLLPDVLTLDLEMPRMDGLTFLRLLQKNPPMPPVVVVSSLTQEGSRHALEAMDAGAADVLAKPDGSMSIGHLANKLAFHVKAAARARRRTAPTTPPPQAARSSPTARTPSALMEDILPSRSTPESPRPQSNVLDRRLIVIGSSTGGVEALRELLPNLPSNLPPIAVAQHIPPFFSKAVADRLNSLADYEIHEAKDGEELHNGMCVIAPGDYHLTIHRVGNIYKTRLSQTPPVHYCRPAVDVLFRSAANAAGDKTLAVILTGMGSDGALGMQAIKQAGGHTLAEHEDTCVVFGMPRAAIQLGAVDHVVPLHQMPAALIKGIHSISPA